MHFLLILNINNFSRKKLLFRSEGPKISRILWFGPKFTQPTDEQAEKGTFKCNGRRSCQICALIVEGGTFRNFNDSRSFTISSGAYHCNSENVVYLLQCDCCNKHGKKSSNFDIVFSLYIRGKRTISLPFPTQNAFYTSNFPPSFPTGKLRVKGNILLPTVSRVRFNVSKSWKLSLH